MARKASSKPADSTAGFGLERWQLRVARQTNTGSQQGREAHQPRNSRKRGPLRSPKQFLRRKNGPSQTGNSKKPTSVASRRSYVKKLPVLADLPIDASPASRLKSLVFPPSLQHLLQSNPFQTLQTARHRQYAIKGQKLLFRNNESGNISNK